jgi:phage protein U
MAILYQVGSLSFEPAPLSPQEFERETGADFVKKDIVGAQRPSEAVGEGDETLSITAVLFPFAFGGLPALDVLDAMRKSQQCQPVMRGDGRWMGLYYIVKVREKHTDIGAFGVGRQIQVTIQLDKEPNPTDDDLAQFLTLFGG